MAENRIGLLKGCAIGCGVLVAFPIVAAIVVGLRTWVPLRSSEKSMVHLEERYGAQDAYVPAPDGAIAPSRVVAFLEVRRSLQGLCEEISTMNGELGGMQVFEKGGSPSPREVAGATRGSQV